VLAVWFDLLDIGGEEVSEVTFQWKDQLIQRVGNRRFGIAFGEPTPSRFQLPILV
jgi:hypothetical protein